MKKQTKQRLSVHQMYFARMIMEVGWHKALKMAGYSKNWGKTLLKDPRIQRYQMSLMGDAMEGIGLTLGDVIKKRMALADDVDTPPILRDSIYEKLMDIFKDTGDDIKDAAMRLSAGKKMLRPSKEIQEAEIISEENNGSNGKSKEESVQAKETVGVYRETDNGSASGNVPQSTGRN